MSDKAEVPTAVPEPEYPDPLETNGQEVMETIQKHITSLVPLMAEARRSIPKDLSDGDRVAVLLRRNQLTAQSSTLKGLIIGIASTARACRTLTQLQYAEVMRALERVVGKIG